MSRQVSKPQLLQLARALGLKPGSRQTTDTLFDACLTQAFDLRGNNEALEATLKATSEQKRPIIAGTIITVYTFEYAGGHEDTFVTQDAGEAEERARKYSMRVFANEYEYSDREVAWDFTEGDSE